MPLLEEKEGNIPVFHPFVGSKAKEYVSETLDSKWIGQGPKVDKFEKEFSNKFCPSSVCLSVGAGTDALHLAYLLAGLKEGDEVIAPLFTCTATNIPFLYMGVKIKFADVQLDTLNLDPNHVRELMSDRVKAIVCVHYGGLPCDMDELQEIADEWGVPIIEDAAHALGASYKRKNIGAISDYTMWSFQAIKHITTGDGGMLALGHTPRQDAQVEKAKRIRWFGIDRAAKQGGIWENDITEIGYKYQMTDLSAALGLASLEEFDSVLAHRRKIFSLYKQELSNLPDVTFVGGNKEDRVHSAWLCTIFIENRHSLQIKLAEHGIESNQCHFRNDRYAIFKEFWENKEFPHMDMIQDDYLVLPLHHRVSEGDVLRICGLIKEGW
ncbi:DegT/DnrJ/EryC1/StrS aminotransferase [bacterium]|nr:DegT/DnrJ/EryC1/StrS aminotransferase [bacterium]